MRESPSGLRNIARVSDSQEPAQTLAHSGSAMRAGAEVAGDSPARIAHLEWASCWAGSWLSETLAMLRSPEGLSRIDPEQGLKTRLRPYQLSGTRWLYLLANLGLGACLADDMGL